MHLQAILAVIAGSSLALAALNRGPAINARQNSGDSASTTSTTGHASGTITSGTTPATSASFSQPACVSSIISFLSSNTASPTVPAQITAELSSFVTGSPEAQASGPAVICQIAKSLTNLPITDGSLETAYQSYMSSYLSYASAVGPTLTSLAKEWCRRTTGDWLRSGFRCWCGWSDGCSLASVGI